ncbi:MAG: putative toxin-antitoxin system toxin component, PIN family [Cellvibrionales bacterium]|nr:MAG: putative toxin-antitoxin system toxin component, PIN family [Cellvibrionales bacterium]
MSQTVVVDTSVIISALIGKKGPSREILRRCLQGHYKPLISNALFQEYEDVISRDRIKNATPLSEKEIRELLSAFYSVCKWVPIYFLWRPNLKDENDNFLIGLALAGNSNLIVTNNIKDLEGAELTFEGLSILKPEQLTKGH